MEYATDTTNEIEVLTLSLINSYDKVYEYDNKADTFYCYNVENGYFKKCLCRNILSKTHPEDIEKMHKFLSHNELMTFLYSDEKERCIESRSKDNIGEYRWFSHVVQRSQNNTVMIFTKNIDEYVSKEKSARKLLTDALVSARRSSTSKSEFLSRISHDIRNPINDILNNAASARYSLGDTDEVADYLENIDNSANMLLNLINGILDMSTIESGHMEIVKEKFNIHNIFKSISAVINIQSNKRNVEFNMFIENSVEQYYVGDPLRLRQVLMNVLSNAIKYTSSGGHVDFIVNAMDAKDGQSVINFVVQDTGQGISEELTERLYHPFETISCDIESEKGGLGLGLAITHNLVELMNGTMDISSSIGKGTKFTIELPLFKSEERASKTEYEEYTDFSKLDILIVDDDISVCEHTSLLLEKHKIRSEFVTTGKMAVSFAKMRRAKKHGYSLILIDWHMPEFDGIQTCKAIRELLGNNTSIAIMSAHNLSEIEYEAKKAGADYFISKPLFSSSLTDLLISVVNKSKGDK